MLEEIGGGSPLGLRFAQERRMGKDVRMVVTEVGAMECLLLFFQYDAQDLAL